MGSGSNPVGEYECIDVGWSDPDGVEHADVSQFTERAEPVHRLGAYVEVYSDLVDRQQRPQPVRRILGERCENLRIPGIRARVVARGSEALLLAGTGSSGLRSRGPQVPLPAGASNARRWAARIWRLQAHDPRNNPPRASSQRNAPTSSLPANGPDLPSPNCLQNWGAFARTREDK